VIQSELLTDPSWKTDLPVKEDTDGEWRWTVSVMLYGRTLATSPEWMFWFNPHPGSGGSDGGKTPTIQPPPPPGQHVHRE
jgi:hypothetical protein